jgi:heptosyltransferase-2
MNIAVFWPNWVGDAAMATPAVHALRTHFPAARLIGVLRPYIAGVLEGAPWPDKQLFLNSWRVGDDSLLKVARQLCRESVDLAILFPNSFRSAFVAWLGKCRRRVGYARYGRSWLLTDALQPLRDGRGKLMPSPVLRAYNRLVEHVACPVATQRLQLFTTERDEAEADGVWKHAGFHESTEVVCVNPGAAFGSAKYWPIEYFASLARYLVERRGTGVLVLCGPNEREMARRIATLANQLLASGGCRPPEAPGVATLADHPLSLGLSKACVRRSDLLVTTDSGPRHFAAAFDRPVITLFGPTHIAWTEMDHAKAVHLQKKVDCGPCQLRVCPYDHRCMLLLQPEEVFEKAIELLTRYPKVIRKPTLQAG